MEKKETIFVGLSGGVDSAVAAKRLVGAGHRVVGVHITVWQPDFLTCEWEKERLDAMRIAAHLGIPFTSFDGAHAYKLAVADYFIAEYKAGRTPNPDVLCNEHVKFGVFLDFALGNGATKVATGHYARIRTMNGGEALFRGADRDKDQSYFLWRLRERQLTHALFPIGDSLKSEVRAEARRACLPVSEKKDSQGICFLGNVDMKDFLSHYIENTEGDVLGESNEYLGKHRGTSFYTIGERIEIHPPDAAPNRKPQYVIRKDTERNVLWVAQHPRVLSSEEVALTEIVMRDDGSVHSCTAQFRYRQPEFPVTITDRDDEYVKLRVDSNAVDAPSPGQSCVLYQGDWCIGGGVVA